MADRCLNCWHATDLHTEGRCRWSGCDCGEGFRLPERPTWAVVPTKNRHEDVVALARSLAGQVRGICVVDNNDVRDDALEDDVAAAGFPGSVMQLHRPGYPPNLSDLYNAGMDAVTQLVNCMVPIPEEWNLCLLNDDVVCPPGWAVSLERALRSSPAALAYTDRLGRAEQLLSTSPPANFNETATLWAAMLRGELGIRYDRRLKWWFGDNLIDLECRLEHGGTVAVPGPMPDHRKPSQATVADPILSRIANQEDAPMYARIVGERWGM